MESTGESNKIQVSEATAHLIQSDGKGYVPVHLHMSKLSIQISQLLISFVYDLSASIVIG